MAVSKVVYAATEFRVAIAEESTFGTAHTTQTDFQELCLTERPDFMPATQIQDIHKCANSGRVLTHQGVFKSNVGGATTITLNGIASRGLLDLLLYGVTQSASDVWSDPNNTATFTIDENNTGVDGSGDPNIHFTIQFHNPSTGEDVRLTSAVIQSLTISKSTGTNGGRLSFSATFFTGFDYEIGAHSTVGSWIAPDTGYYTLDLLDVKKFGVLGSLVDVVLGDWSITITNNVVRVGETAAGNAEAYGFGLSDDGFNVTAEVSVKYDANTDQLIDAFRIDPASTPATSLVGLQLTYDDGNTNELDILLDGFITAMPFDFGNEQGVFQTISVRGCQDSSLNDMLSIVMTNQTNRGW